MPNNMNPTSNTQTPPLRIAIPVSDGRLHGHFGGCRAFALVEADAETKTVRATKVVSAPPHQPGLFPRWLREQGVQVVIAGGIGQRALAAFAHHGITVRAGAPDTPIEPLVAAYLSGQLTMTPDGCNHHEHHHDHEHGHHHHHDSGHT